MSSSPEFLDYVLEQIALVWTVTYKKMFWEYSLYLDWKMFAVICDDQFFLKPTSKGREVLTDIVEAPPYTWAKNYFLIENLEDKEYMSQIIKESWAELPYPKPKKAKKFN